MKKVIISVLALAFLVSASGCTCRSEHDKVLKEKASIEKRHAELTQENARLKNQISAVQRMKGDLAKLIQKNARLEAKAFTLQREKESLEQQLQQATAKTGNLTSE